MEKSRVVIVGGGVVGCAIAASVSKSIEDVFVIEELPRVGMATSSRNSGVIHSGIYYPPGSLKARHSVEGNRMTYEFCARHNVPHRKTGKYVVATCAEEEPKLEELLNRGRANGTEGLEIVSGDQMRRHEPHVQGRLALRVPSAGIVEAEELTKAFARIAVNQGAHIVTEAKLEAVTPSGSEVKIRTTAGELETQVFVNSAGLFADEVAALFGNRNHRIYPVRGEYWEVTKAKADLICGLVYPAPHPTGLSLGVHLTKTLGGTLLLGPNAKHVADKNDYENDRERVESFCAEARLLLPQLNPEDMRRGYAGLRPKLIAPGEKGHGEFVIKRDASFPHVIHLIGIDSPGLTSAVSIGPQIARMVAETLS